MSIGMISGIGLPFIKYLNNELLILIILVFGTASVVVFSLRETKNEYELRNLYSDIFPEEYDLVYTSKREYKTKKD
jgi:hypothetical protein